MQDAEQPYDDEEEMDEVGDDESPDGAKKVKDKAFEDDEKLEDDNRRQEASGVAARRFFSRSLQK